MLVTIRTNVKAIADLAIFKVPDRRVRTIKITKWCMWGERDAFKQWVGVCNKGHVHFTSNLNHPDVGGRSRERALLRALKNLRVISIADFRAWNAEADAKFEAERAAVRAVYILRDVGELKIKISKRERERLEKIASAPERLPAMVISEKGRPVRRTPRKA